MFGFVSSAGPQTLATPVFRLQDHQKLTLILQILLLFCQTSQGKDDVFLRSPLATLFNPPLFSTPTSDTSSFSNIRYIVTLKRPGILEDYKK